MPGVNAPFVNTDLILGEFLEGFVLPSVKNQKIGLQCGASLLPCFNKSFPSLSFLLLWLIHLLRKCFSAFRSALGTVRVENRLESNPEGKANIPWF